MAGHVLILGAGGHAKVVAGILQLSGFNILGFLDDNIDILHTRPLGLPVLGSIDRCRDFSFDGLIMGIGDNVIRKKVVERLGETATPYWINAIHPSAVIAPSVQMGLGITIVAHAVINEDAVIGNHVIINTSATVDHDCQIEDYAHVAPGTNLAGETRIGTGVLMGIGSRTIPQCSVGDWAIVGAGGTVIKNIPPQVIAKGTPARWQEAQKLSSTGISGGNKNRT